LRADFNGEELFVLDTFFKGELGTDFDFDGDFDADVNGDVKGDFDDFDGDVIGDFDAGGLIGEGVFDLESERGMAALAGGKLKGHHCRRLSLSRGGEGASKNS